MAAQSGFDRLGFADIPESGGCRMGVDVIDLLRVDSTVFHGDLDRPRSPIALRHRSGHVVGVRRASVTGNLAINPGSSAFGVLIFLEDHDAGSLAHDKAVAVAVERPAGLLRLVISQAHRLHGCEAADPERGERGLASAREKNVRIAELDNAPGLAQRVVGGGARGHDAHVRAAKIVFHRDDSAGHVRNHHRDRERGDARRPAFQEALAFVLHGAQPADAASNDHAEAVAVHGIEGDPGVL